MEIVHAGSEPHHAPCYTVCFFFFFFEDPPTCSSGSCCWHCSQEYTTFK